MIKLLIPLFSILIFGVSTVYADQITILPENPREVTLETPFNIGAVSCVENIYSELPYMTCTIYGETSPSTLIINDAGVIEDCAQQNLVYDWTDQSCKTEQQFEDEALQDCIDAEVCDDQTKITPDKPTKEELLITKLESKHKLTLGDRILIDLTKMHDDVCTIDIDTIQTYRELENVPREQVIDPDTGEMVWQWHIPNLLKSIDYQNNRELRIIMLEINECAGEQILKKMLGVNKLWGTYSDTRITGEDDFQPYHADIAKHIPPISASQLMNIENEGKIKPERYLPICDSSLYSQETKKLFKCLDSDNDGTLDFHDDCPKKPGPSWTDGCPMKELQIAEMRDYGNTGPFAAWIEYQKDPDSQLDVILSKIANYRSDTSSIGGGQ